MDHLPRFGERELICLLFLPRFGERELICLLFFTCNYVVLMWSLLAVLVSDFR